MKLFLTNIAILFISFSAGAQLNKGAFAKEEEDGGIIPPISAITTSFLSNSKLAEEKNKIRTIGISIPIIWNNSEATFYRLGSPKYPSGKAISYGINLDHSRTIYKKLFGIVGIGYFKQKFGISRPFKYVTPDSTKPLFNTESYSYDNIHLIFGIGSQKKINKDWSIKGTVTYNWLNSFRQKYIVNKDYKTWQVNKKSMSIGRKVNLNIGIERNITKKISIGLDALLPILTHWNNDKMFIDNYYSSDEQQIARNKFSIGTVISCNYNF